MLNFANKTNLSVCFPDIPSSCQNRYFNLLAAAVKVKQVFSAFCYWSGLYGRKPGLLCLSAGYATLGARQKNIHSWLTESPSRIITCSIFNCCSHVNCRLHMSQRSAGSLLNTSPSLEDAEILSLCMFCVPKAAAVAQHTTFRVLFTIHLDLESTRRCRKAVVITMQWLETFWFFSAFKRGKGCTFTQARQRLLTGISVPHIRCCTTKGNLSLSWIRLQHDVCKRLVRRRVIEGRKGWCV